MSTYYLCVNNLIEWVTGDENNRVDRVLWIDDNNEIAFVIDIRDENSLPRQVFIEEINNAFSSSEAIVLKKDPWTRLVDEESLSNKNKSIRDTAWDIIEPIVIQEPSIYDPKYRGSIISSLISSEKSNESHKSLTKRTIYKYLRRYWQRGKIKNSLLPDYSNSGGKGKQREAGDKKRGRPRKHANLPEIGTGINVTEDTKKIFRVGISQFYHTSKKMSLKSAYERTIENYYTEDDMVDYGNSIDSNNLVDRIPTFRQFQYFYDREFGKNIEKKISSRIGKREYLQNYRPITGNSTSETTGPGDRYQVDATIADVYLVSTYNRNWIIGRPVIYVVIDVFSRMITGVYVGLEGPSWNGMMMALANTTMDKVEYCKEYGIDIVERDWPCHHLPNIILGDRGELISKNVETIVLNLNIKIENAAPFRPDWKGIVEERFGKISGTIKPTLPGAVDITNIKRGSRDYRLDAKLDLEQFTQIIIDMILHHNNEHALEDYPRSLEMIEDEVLAIPIEIWNWGIVNCAGRLRTIDPDLVKLNLMPKGNATITERGIKFKGMYYNCDRAEQEMWFANARAGNLSRSEKKIEVSYDGRKMNYIYIPASDGRSFDRCFLIDPMSKYTDKNLYDIEYLFAEEQLQQQLSANRELPKKIELNKEIDRIVELGTEMTESQQDTNLSNRKRTSEIRKNRGREKEERRQQEAFDLSQQDNKNTEAKSRTNRNNLPENTVKKSLKPTYDNLINEMINESSNYGGELE